MSALTPAPDRFTREEVIAAGRAIQKAQRIAVISPANLDGDSLGACCALHLVMKQLGKHSELICVTDIPDAMKFIPTIHEFQKELDTSRYDLFIIPDTAEPKLTGFEKTHPELFDGSKEFINIDHHISNKYFGTINIVRPTYASATMVVYRLLKYWNVQVTPDMATSLLVGLYTDTGSFMHSNTTPEAYLTAAALVAHGANVNKLVKSIFKTMPLSTMRLWGRVLSRVRQNDRKVTVAYVTEQDFSETGALPEELTGVVDFINSVPDSYFSLLLHEFEGKIKGSLRTLRDDINLSKIAGVFGGGGHAKASGFTIPGRLSLEEHLKVQPA